MFLPNLPVCMVPANGDHRGVWWHPRCALVLARPLAYQVLPLIPSHPSQLNLWKFPEQMYKICCLILVQQLFLQACQYLTDYLHHFVAFWFPNKLWNFWSNRITGTHKLNQGFLKNPSKTNFTMQVWDGQPHKSPQPLRLISNRSFWSQTLKRKF